MDQCACCNHRYYDGIIAHRLPNGGTEFACYECLHKKYPEQYPIPASAAA